MKEERERVGCGQAVLKGLLGVECTGRLFWANLQQLQSPAGRLKAAPGPRMKYIGAPTGPGPGAGRGPTQLSPRPNFPSSPGSTGRSSPKEPSQTQDATPRFGLEGGRPGGWRVGRVVGG